MKQEEQNLLVKDLCCRLPYGVKFECNKNVYTAKGLDLIVTDEGDWEYAVTAKGIAPIEIDFIKPYLFPMPNKDEDEEYNKFLDELIEIELKVISGELEREHSFEFEMNYYHKNHIDYRGLIPKGLAIDATGKNIY